jgi:hypothetical protein
MALEPLLAINELKTTRLSAERPISSIDYDDDLDTLFLRLITPIGRTAVYFVDDSVGLVYEIDSLEVVGIQIEYFVEYFLPAHQGVEQAWSLSSTSHPVHDFGELILTFQKMRPKVAHEVLQATGDILEPQAAQLAEALKAA